MSAPGSMPGGIGGAPEAVAGTPAFAGQRRLFPADLTAPPGGRDAAGWGVHRVMGTESEFGIHAPANPGAHHSVLSVELVNSYADLITHSGGAVAGTEWDYAGESPLVDARGWRMPRSAAHPSQLTDQALVGPDGEPVHLLLSTVLPNGARWYVDHAHPEYSSPEVASPREAVVWDAAGDRVAQAAAEHIAAAEGAPEVLVYKNNTDGKGQSYGSHENYLVARALPFDELAEVLLPFFAARQVLVGAGRVGVGLRGERPGFQLSQRADFFEEQVGLETTIRRPIVNTRDEPHARGDAYRRLHVIIGDANLSQHATWLRMGMTALVLALAEAGTAPRIVLDDPVAALQTISHDPTLRAAVPGRERGADGVWTRREWTGLQILGAYLDAAREHCARCGVDDAETAAVLDAWGTDLADAAADPLALADRADWAAKLRVLEGLRARGGLDWSDPRLAMVDLQYADLRPAKSLHRRLVAAGAMRVLVEDAEVEAAVVAPPRSTRAWTRGNLVRHHARQVSGAAWDSVLVRAAEEAPLHRLRLEEPLVGAAEDLPGWWDDTPGSAAPAPEPNELVTRLGELLRR
ncbi:proteasome accessory factor PafA2 [Micrococcus porci]|uniref:depupylase/deamidase Dop n=1 Tax=Micrococcus porci TaxID=2856555 RepID=UPI001CC94F8C|nr:depupylase/deamidase Dop [Micrococcus porci]UBH23861.1 proteasome accessory factor PafA2 [Micrococcus porci]